MNFILTAELNRMSNTLISAKILSVRSFMWIKNIEDATVEIAIQYNDSFTETHCRSRTMSTTRKAEPI